MIKFIKFILKLIIIALPFLLVLGFIIFAYYYHDLPSIDDLNNKNDTRSIELLYTDGNKITTVGDLYDNQVMYNEIPQYLIDAVVATEDRKFFTHHGFDSIGIIRAFIANHKAGRIVQGGSTITQQLTKLLYFDSSRSIKRKVQELLLAIRIERIFSKEQILTMYLNRAYFGAGNYGIANASKYYFNKKVSNLNLNQSAILAGLLKAPSKLSPSKNKKLAENRANQVLANMVDAGYLEKEDLGLLGNEINYKTDKLQKLYFADFVTENFDDYLPKNQKEQKFFSVQTTLNETIQNVSEDAVDSYATKYQKILKNSQIAVLVMEKDGAIRGMIGGKNYQKSQFNRAIYSKRQPGSVFKTFIYLQSFIQGFEIDDVMEDKIIKIGNWHPENYNNHYYGEVTLKRAFSESLNSIAIQLFQQIDKEQLIQNIRKMGIFNRIDESDPTTALGTMQVTLLELVTSFSVITNNGKGVIPYQIIKIDDESGKNLYSRESSGIGQVLDKEPIYKIKQLLREVVENGTGKKANVNEYIYGKTGTTQNYRDAWFLGSNDKYIVGVWIGNDNNSPTNKITGGDIPAEIFADIMSRLSN